MRFSSVLQKHKSFTAECNTTVKKSLSQLELSQKKRPLLSTGKAKLLTLPIDHKPNDSGRTLSFETRWNSQIVIEPFPFPSCEHFTPTGLFLSEHPFILSS
jgi:hypothetical protein